MKNLYLPLLAIAATILIFVHNPVDAQQRQARPMSKEVLNAKKAGLEAAGRHGFTGQKRYPSKSVNNNTDTLNYPLAGEYALYVYDGGYVSGNNDYGDLAKANYFASSQAYMVTGVLIDFGWATGGNTDIEIAVWANSKSPGNKIGSQMIGLQSIINDVTNDQTTFVNFDDPVIVNGDFYVGVVLPTAAGDTVALMTNTDGDTDPATAWEHWSDQTWYPYDDPMSWDYKISHAIFPIVQSGDFLIADFMAATTNIAPGESVQFTDQSTGDPDSWEWTFEGGDPATSTLQNPMVTYNDEGVFEVSLTVTKGGETNTLTKENYIHVSAGSTSDIDTLNFPLPGEYILYIIQNNGGFVNGNNVYGDLAKANQFTVDQQAKLTGILYDFAWATGGNPDIEMAVWGHNLSTGKPGMKTGSTTIPLNTIKNDIQNQSLTWVPFDPPIDVNQNFYAGFILPQAAGDTLVVWGNTDGDTNPGTAWDLFSDNTWHPFNESGSWEINIALGIHPVVEYVTGIDDHPADFGMNLFPNPVSDRLQISWNTTRTESPVIQLLSVEGTRLENKRAAKDSDRMLLDMEPYPAGVYFIRVIGEQGVQTKKFIKR